MLTLIRQGTVFAPDPLGKKDILISNDTIAAVSEPGQIDIKGIEIKSINASDKIIIPGLIDSHVHILGGGGEGGPATRAPEIAVEDIIESGVTTVIGCLGTDGTTRHMESLLAKARGLEEEGITTFLFSGSYRIPPPTLTGSLRSDLILIDKVIGAGEIAISDHRSSQPTYEEITRLAADCRVGGMLGGKAGILHLHLGDGPRKLEMLFRLIEETEIPVTQLIPTHVNRNRSLFDDAIRFIQSGGFIDMTAGNDPAAMENDGLSIKSAIQICLEQKASLSQVTISSDSNGSMPVFDEKGNLHGLTVATQKSLWRNIRHMVKKNVLKLHEAIKPLTVNPAIFYKLHQKGEIKVRKDADLILLDTDLNITDSFARGRQMLADKKLLVRGTFSLE